MSPSTAELSAAELHRCPLTFMGAPFSHDLSASTQFARWAYEQTAAAGGLTWIGGKRLKGAWRMTGAREFRHHEYNSTTVRSNSTPYFARP